jgi:uroporphyrin-3 C-methyltransferase
LLAAAALVISLLSAGATAWLWLGERGPDALAAANRDEIERLSATLGNARDTLQDSDERLSALNSRDRELGESIDSMERSLRDGLRPLGSVPGRLSSMEATLAALQGISAGVRDSWLLAEAGYYMEIANAQLQLAGNPGLARIALQLADERIATIASPGLTDVRRALADELRALDAVDTPDIEGAALMLASLAETVDSLPLRSDVTESARRDVGVDEELSGTERALASLKSALSDVVSVRRTDDQDVTPLLPPDAAYFLRSNLTLQLQAARLALLRGEQTLYEQSLDDAAKWIGEYFDGERTPVRSAAATIAELREAQTAGELPDISRSLTLLRRYLALQAEDREATPGQRQ